MPPDDDVSEMTSTDRPGNILAISPFQYRQQAAQCKALAAAAASDGERQIFLKMASVWLHAAMEFETGTNKRDQEDGADLAP
jgi:hypothetical protein